MTSPFQQDNQIYSFELPVVIMLWLMRWSHCLSERIQGESIISLAKCCQWTVQTTLTLLCISLKLGAMWYSTYCVPTNYVHEPVLCTLARASLVGHSITVSSSVDVVSGEGALQGTGLLGVDLLLGGMGTRAATGMGRAIRHNWTFSWGAWWTGSIFTLESNNTWVRMNHWITFL